MEPNRRTHPAFADALRQAAQAGYACTIDDAISVGPTIGAHVGPGVFGLAYVSAQA